MKTKLGIVEFARNSGHIVRFIEFMPLDGEGIWQTNLVFSKNEMINVIIKNIGNIPINCTNSSDSMNMLNADPQHSIVLLMAKES